MTGYNNIINLVGDIQEIPTNLRASQFLSFTSWTEEPPCEVGYTLGRSLWDPAFNAQTEWSIPVVLFDPCGPSSDNGCEQLDMKECSEVSVLFASWRTLWTCLTLASMAFAARTGSDYYINETRDEFARINDALEPLGMSTESFKDFNVMRVYNLTYECARASCDEWSMDGDCSIEYPQSPEFTLVNDGFDLASDVWWGGVLSYSFAGLCDDLPTVNLDIAGQGVLISYTIQSIFVVVLVVILRMIFLESTVNFFAAPYLIFRAEPKSQARGARQSFTKRHPRLRRFFRRTQDNTLVHAVMTMLVDFQEAQCFFLMGVQVAVLVATSQRAGFHGTFTLFSLRGNRRANRDLSHMGIMAVCLVQMVLHRLKMDSAYTLALSLCAVGVALLARELGFDRGNISTTMESIHELMPVDECGKMGSLRLQCLGQTNFIGFRMKLMEVVQQTVYLVALFILCCSKFSKEVAGCRFGRIVCRPLPVWATSRRSRIMLSSLTNVALGGCELALVVTNCMNLIELLGYVGGPTNGKIYGHNAVVQEFSGQPVWNIGQVLAILIWVPVLFKFSYILMQGIEAGFRVRLSNAYVVRRREDWSTLHDGETDIPNASRRTSIDSLQQDEEEGQKMQVLQPPDDSSVSADDAAADRLELRSVASRREL